MLNMLVKLGGTCISPHDKKTNYNNNGNNSNYL